MRLIIGLNGLKINTYNKFEAHNNLKEQPTEKHTCRFQDTSKALHGTPSSHPLIHTHPHSETGSKSDIGHAPHAINLKREI